jgi:O-antigen/teichoic acid export membrane protein
MILGPEGMGISQLFVSSTNTMKQAASCGLPMSIVREVAAARDSATADFDMATVVAVARRAVKYTTALAVVVCIACSLLLSRATFNSDAYMWSYVALSLMMVFAVLGDGEMAILQGLHRVKSLSKSSLVGAVTGLVAGVPLYYFFGYRGIVPAMIVQAFTMWAFYRINTRREAMARVAVPAEVRRVIMRRIFSLGVVLMAGSVLTTLVAYLVNMWIRARGSVDDVGLYQAANTIAGQYIAVVFSAMSLDYFPRLSAVVSDNAKMATVVNRQFDLVGLLMAPISIAIVLTAPVLIRVLTSEQFMSIVPLVRWMALGLFLRAMAYPMGYIAFAKGNKRLYFYLEGVWGSIEMLVVSCLCYWVCGLTGLGIAVVIIHALDVVVYYVVNHRAYGYSIDRATLRLMVMLFVPVLLAFLATYIPDEVLSYAVITVLLVTSCIGAFIGIRHRLR